MVEYIGCITRDDITTGGGEGDDCGCDCDCDGGGDEVEVVEYTGRITRDIRVLHALTGASASRSASSRTLSVPPCVIAIVGNIADEEP